MRFVFPAGRGSCNTVRMSVLGIQILSGRVGHLYAFPYFPDFSRKFSSTSLSSLSTFSTVRYTNYVRKRKKPRYLVECEVQSDVLSQPGFSVSSSSVTRPVWSLLSSFPFPLLQRVCSFQACGLVVTSCPESLYSFLYSFVTSKECCILVM